MSGEVSAPRRVVVAPSIATEEPKLCDALPREAKDIHLLPQMMYMEQVNHEKSYVVHASSDVTEGGGIKPLQADNGFVQAVFHAYSNHCALRISPDDIWLMVLQQFSQHITLNAEKYRRDFVQHEGRMTLTVRAPGWGPDSTDWPWIVGRFADLIRDNTVAAVADAFEPGFSTTTVAARCAALGMLTSAMKHYFRYCAEFCCGIPEVVMTGTRADWASLLSKVVHLGTLGEAGASVAPWLDKVASIVDMLVATFDGNPDVERWSHILSRRTYGSGSEVFTGWFTDFFLYGADNKPFPESAKWSDFPPCFSRTPIEIPESGQLVELVAGAWHWAVFPDGSVGSVPQWLVMEEKPAK